MSRARIRCSSARDNAFGIELDATTNRKGREVVRLSLLDLDSNGSTTNSRFLVSLSSRKARRLAEWILENTTEE